MARPRCRAEVVDPRRRAVGHFAADPIRRDHAPPTVNSCGDECVYIKAGVGGSQARLVDGQWVLDTMNNVTCSDGAYVLYATNSHLTWDPNTLAGTAEHTYLIPACGHPAGYSYTDQIQIKQSS
ncbi:hypothetical protein MYSE111917_23000 [Mycobacterium senriense]|uniref:Secreted protein n=1 Tax=Mycobacterium senriense TaxID=2775496 RepID=A0ABM7SU21_9MYCO|nr:hypothetical protein MTY59_11760 [Mycobacterium senriense]